MQQISWMNKWMNKDNEGDKRIIISRSEGKTVRVYNSLGVELHPKDPFDFILHVGDTFVCDFDGPAPIMTIGVL